MSTEENNVMAKRSRKSGRNGSRSFASRRVSSRRSFSRRTRSSGRSGGGGQTLRIVIDQSPAQALGPAGLGLMTTDAKRPKSIF